MYVRSPDLKRGMIFDCLSCCGITPSLRDFEKIIKKGLDTVNKIFFTKAEEIPSVSTVLYYPTSNLFVN